MNLTPWFNKNTKPVHIRIYERSYKDAETAYNYWNGKFWGYVGVTPYQAVIWKDWKSINQNLPWRGLLK